MFKTNLPRGRRTQRGSPPECEGWTGGRSFDDLDWFVRSEKKYFYFFLFLSCLGFLTSFLRTLLPLPMRGLLWVDSVQFDGAMVMGGGTEVTGAGHRNVEARCSTHADLRRIVRRDAAGKAASIFRDAS